MGDDNNNMSISDLRNEYLAQSTVSTTEKRKDDPMITLDSSVEDVQHWLNKASLSSYAESFLKYKIDGEQFAKLDKEILTIGFDVKKFEDWWKILQKVKTIQRQKKQLQH